MSRDKYNNVDSRELRRRRRVRSVALAYTFLIIIIAAIGVGGFLGVSRIHSTISANKAAKAQAEAEAEAARIAEQEAEMQKVLESTEEAEEESEEEVVEEYTTEDLLNEVVQSCIADMTLEDKVAGLFIISPEQLTGQNNVTRAGDGTKKALEEIPVGGIIYSSGNVKDSTQLSEMLANTVSYCKYPLFLAADEELGAKNIGSKLKLEATDNAAKLGEAGDANVALESYKQIGEYLISNGFNLNFAPVADITYDNTGDYLKNRSFGSDVSTASNFVVSSIAGLKEAGMYTGIKYFPGQGSADGDTSKGKANSDMSVDDFRSNDIMVFMAGIDSGADIVMVGNFTAPSLTGDETTPCSLSKEVMTDLLRSEYQYDGVIITDALNKPSITEYYAADEVAVKALKAGADMLLMPEDFKTAYEAVVAAVKDGTISEQRINDSLARVFRIKYRSTIE